MLVHLPLCALQHLFLSISASPELSFAAYGGFLLLDAGGVVVGVQAVCEAATDEDNGAIRVSERRSSQDDGAQPAPRKPPRVNGAGANRSNGRSGPKETRTG